ncbi:MAG: hypothetical protein ACI8QC_002267 [Planctomycetota bacterium]|jgi:hypothetical protein
MDDHEGMSAWRAARTFQELCELGARFLEDEPLGFPGWLPGELDDESDELAPLLARAQRAGFLTLASQPGSAPEPGADGRLERRRAFVFGFASGTLAKQLLQACADASLLSADFGAQESGGEAWPVAERAQQAFLLVGDGQGPAELEIFADALGPGPALDALRQTRYLVLADPEWGPSTRLWEVLANAIASQAG